MISTIYKCKPTTYIWKTRNDEKIPLMGKIKGIAEMQQETECSVKTQKYMNVYFFLILDVNGSMAFPYKHRTADTHQGKYVLYKQ